MSWVATGVGVVGTVAGSLLSSSSSDKAARAAKRQTAASLAASKSASKRQHAQYIRTREDLTPWREAGGEAVNTLSQMVQAGPGDYTQSPGYAFRLGEGEKAIERSAAARGSALDPSTMNALQRYGQNYATQDYDNFLNRYYQSLTPYQSLSGVGLTATGSTAAAGQNAANQMGQYAMAPVQYVGQSGMAQAQGTANQGNILSNFANQISGLAGSGAYSDWFSKQNATKGTF